MQDDIRDILIDRYAIQARVYKMAQQLAADYENREFVLMPLLTGSIIFVADLVRHLPVLMRIDVMAVSSYPGRATSNQGTRILYPTKFDVAGKHVLVIDDILDSGRTLKSVRNLLAEQQAASVKTCVLLKKRLPAAPATEADYLGFEIPDEFVVGYGLDYNGYYRNLPDIAILHKRIFEPGPAGA
ncbi:MAG TPA: hypoxanthine phosphoribosyltransferase [Phycisphaerae bacterium]|nr:hypoxanthine phosphoribosyltransferase [Phycisphaerae bacterium]